VADALTRIDDFRCYGVTAPLALSVSFKHRLPAELLEYLPIVTRSDAFTVEIGAADITEASAILSFMTQYSLTRF
jgi:D-aminopeptidase